jgi:hypothetical protein
MLRVILLLLARRLVIGALSGGRRRTGRGTTNRSRDEQWKRLELRQMKMMLLRRPLPSSSQLLKRLIQSAVYLSFVPLQALLSTIPLGEVEGGEVGRSIEERGWWKRAERLQQRAKLLRTMLLSSFPSSDQSRDRASIQQECDDLVEPEMMGEEERSATVVVVARVRQTALAVLAECLSVPSDTARCTRRSARRCSSDIVLSRVSPARPDEAAGHWPRVSPSPPLREFTPWPALRSP